MGTTTKIMLVLVIVSGLVGAVLGVFYVPSKIQTKIDAVSKEASDRVSKANIDLATVKSKFEQSESALTTTKSELASANIENTKLKSDNDSLNTSLIEGAKQSLENKQLADDAVKQRDNVQKQLAAYQGYKKTAEEFQTLGVSVDDIKKQLEELKTLRNTAIANKGGKMVDGVSGTIRNVDPKYGFVTIDIGAAKGVKTAGLMSVTRNGKFVGQIKVRTVQPSLSIADIVKGMTKEELKEGDVVVVTNF